MSHPARSTKPRSLDIHSRLFSLGANTCLELYVPQATTGLSIPLPPVPPWRSAMIWLDQALRGRPIYVLKLLVPHLGYLNLEPTYMLVGNQNIAEDQTDAPLLNVGRAISFGRVRAYLYQAGLLSEVLADCGHLVQQQRDGVWTFREGLNPREVWGCDVLDGSLALKAP